MNSGPTIKLSGDGSGDSPGRLADAVAGHYRTRPMWNRFDEGGSIESGPKWERPSGRRLRRPRLIPRRSNERANAMDSSRSNLKRQSDADPPTSGRDGLPFDQDAADVQAGPNVQANGQAASNGQQDGLAMAGADVAKPEADPFDLDSLRLSQDFASAVGVKRLIKTVPVKKPSKEWFVRTHPDPAYRLQTAVLELKEDRETYLVSPGLWPELAAETTFSPRLLVDIDQPPGSFVRLADPAPRGRWQDRRLEPVRDGRGR